MQLQDVIDRVRLEIGDPLTPFRTSAPGDGVTQWFDLPNQQLQQLSVAIVNGPNYTELVEFSAAEDWSPTTAYSTGTQVVYQGNFYVAAQSNTNQAPVPGGNAYWTDQTDVAFVVNDLLGQVQLGQPAPNNAVLVMAGNSWSLFSDEELGMYATDAVNEHVHGRSIEERFYDAYGRITYRPTPVNLSNLPAIEEPLVVCLAVINTFYVLANDTATDFNVNTAEGTNIDRTTQYNNILKQIQLQKARYQEYCAQLNVGMYRAEVMELRRTSYTTGRYVPNFKPQEYDDHRWPTRVLPPSERNNEDNSGIPSPLWNGNFGGV